NRRARRDRARRLVPDRLRRAWQPPGCGRALRRRLPVAEPDRLRRMSAVLHSVTANRLADGAVVFRRDDGSWTLRVEEAAVLGEAEARALRAAAGRDAAAAIVVAPYLIEVASVDGQVRPTGYRERIRAYGPSRAFHRDVPTRHP